MVVHLFFALTVSIRWRLLFLMLCWFINTKSMVVPTLMNLRMECGCSGAAKSFHMRKWYWRTVRASVASLASRGDVGADESDASLQSIVQ
jgi:hypothetical protein